MHLMSHSFDPMQVSPISDIMLMGTNAAEDDLGGPNGKIPHLMVPNGGSKINRPTVDQTTKKQQL